MLGARTFLRGLDYAKRGVVENVNVEPGEARGQVKGSDPDPYSVTITLTDEASPAIARALRTRRRNNTASTSPRC